jgi:hypothetical protein
LLTMSVRPTKMLMLPTRSMKARVTSAVAGR